MKVRIEATLWAAIQVSDIVRDADLPLEREASNVWAIEVEGVEPGEADAAAEIANEIHLELRDRGIDENEYEIRIEPNQ